MAPKISKIVGDLSLENLRFLRQLGVEELTVPSRMDARQHVRPLVPAAQVTAPGPQPAPWNTDALRQIREHVSTFGLQATTLNLPLSGSIVMGGSSTERDLDTVATCVARAAQAGFRVLTYSFTALRASAGYALRAAAGRGGADLRDFDATRLANLPPLPAVGCHGMEQMWERLVAFLEHVVPVAEDAGVRLAVHPNDPPVRVFRGVAQPLWNWASMRRLLTVIDTPANAVFLDTGVATEWREDAIQVTRELAARDRIGAVHFRNVRVLEPAVRYLETFVDAGDADMPGCMQALVDAGYSGGVDPDHTPRLTADDDQARAGWALAIGYMIGLRQRAQRDGGGEATPS